MHACSAFPSPFQNLCQLEEVLYDLPPLEGVFLHWNTHGVTSTTVGISSLLARRKQVLGPTTLSGASIQLLFECATDSLRCLHQSMQDLHNPWDRRPLDARLLRHRSSLSADQTQALLPPGVLVQKTVSMTLADTLLLSTGAGLHRVTRQHLRAVSADLDLPRRALKRCAVNPEAYNPVETFSM